MKVLLAGATDTLSIPLVRASVAGGHEVIGLSRTAGKRDKLRSLGASRVYELTEWRMELTPGRPQSPY